MSITRKCAALGAVLALALTGCGQTTEPDQGSADSSGPVVQEPDETLSGSLIVFAAVSLTDTFNAIGAAFQEANPEVEITFSFDGSPTLVSQIEQGAPADVFASADQPNMEKLTTAGLASDPTFFAANSITVAVPADNPAGVTALADLGKPEVKTVLCAAEVPCGAASKRVLEAAGVTLEPVSQEQNVKSVVTKLTLGEADAGMVYVTDVAAAAGAITAIPLPDDAAVQSAARTDYPIAVVEASTNTDLAAAFVSFVLSQQGQQILGDAGFLAPLR
ncbi:MAG: molybdate ABC transporter substrate-binding protein [Propionibacteriaceae bacterium]|nr:molybdate ABC transporter substrate-binding protein [Propionibacteriaceae bacterium]